MIYKHFKCPKCLKISRAGEWNNETKLLCVTEQQKKMYKNIQLAGHGQRWYRCPKCMGESDIRFIGKVKESEVLS